MRICIFSDTHGNAAALEAMLADAKRQGAFDLTVMLGDLALLGPRPAETVDLIRALGCLVVKGNTDAMLVERTEHPAMDWTLEQLGSERTAYLSELPFSYRVEPEAGHGLLLFHATPRNLIDTLNPNYSDAELRAAIAGFDDEVLAFGHVHVAYVRRLGNQTLFDVGSVGLPRDGDRRAAYGIAEWKEGGWLVTHRRVAYDAEAVAAELRVRGGSNGSRQAEILLSASY